MSQVAIMEQMGMHVVERIYYNNIIGYIFLFMFTINYEGEENGVGIWIVDKMGK